MNNSVGGPWDALRRAYAPAQHVGAVPAGEASPLPPQAHPAPEVNDDLETRIDLAEERAAILEFDGGMTRARAEALAYRAHGLPPPSAKT